MIELKVEEYCHNCPDFKAVVIKSGGVTAHYDWANGSELVVSPTYTTIHCAHDARCRAVKRYLEKQQKGE